MPRLSRWAASESEGLEEGGRAQSGARAEEDEGVAQRGSLALPHAPLGVQAIPSNSLIIPQQNLTCSLGAGVTARLLPIAACQSGCLVAVLSRATALAEPALASLRRDPLHLLRKLPQ